MPIIRVEMFKGRTPAQKKAIAKDPSRLSAILKALEQVAKTGGGDGQAAGDGAGAQLTGDQLRGALSRRFDVEYVTRITAKDVDVRREGDDQFAGLLAIEAGGVLASFAETCAQAGVGVLQLMQERGVEADGSFAGVEVLKGEPERKF